VVCSSITTNSASLCKLSTTMFRTPPRQLFVRNQQSFVVEVPFQHYIIRRPPKTRQLLETLWGAFSLCSPISCQSLMTCRASCDGPCSFSAGFSKRGLGQAMAREVCLSPPRPVVAEFACRGLGKRYPTHVDTIGDPSSRRNCNATAN
jgi:hypothetical protein